MLLKKRDVYRFPIDAYPGDLIFVKDENNAKVLLKGKMWLQSKKTCEMIFVFASVNFFYRMYFFTNVILCVEITHDTCVETTDLAGFF